MESQTSSRDGDLRQELHAMLDTVAPERLRLVQVAIEQALTEQTRGFDLTDTLALEQRFESAKAQRRAGTLYAIDDAKREVQRRVAAKTQRFTT